MLKRIRNKIDRYFSRLQGAGIPVILTAAVMVLVTLAVFLVVYKGIFTYELHHAYTADAPLYWTVGRGMLNGLTPYAEMYENKPIGVFLISALSFALTDSTVLCNIVSILAAVAIAVLPALTVLYRVNRHEEKGEIGRFRIMTVFLTVLLSGMLLAVYSETRSGAFQVEAIGAAFSVLFIYLIVRLRDAVGRKKRIILTLLAGIALGCAVMTKEPFLFVAVIGALLFIEGFKDFIRNLLLPCVAGGALTLGLLAVTGTLVPYFTIYVKRMFETRLSGGSSVFERARDIPRVINDIKAFSGWLFYLILFFLALSLLRAVLRKQSLPRFFLSAAKIAAAIYLASFCVGVGGYYYYHHYIFAVPVYCALVVYGGSLLYEFKPGAGAARRAVILIWVAVLLTMQPQLKNTYAGDYTGRFNQIQAQAEYVDSLLDFYGEERYQFIGFNGENVFIGLTKHSPQGPVFGQDSDNFQTADTWFSQSLMKQLDESNIVIVREYLAPAINEDIGSLLAAEFTETPARRFAAQLPLGFDCRIYYRTSVYG